MLPVAEDGKRALLAAALHGGGRKGLPGSEDFCEELAQAVEKLGQQWAHIGCGLAARLRGDVQCGVEL